MTNRTFRRRVNKEQTDGLDPKAFQSSIYYTGSDMDEFFIRNPEIRRIIEQINQLSYADHVHESNKEKQVQNRVPLCRGIHTKTWKNHGKAVWPPLLNNAAREKLSGKTALVARRHFIVN
jgi:hypothetical protein